MIGVMNRLAAVVPATDRPPTLAVCLKALEAAAEPPEQVIVVSDPPGLGPAAARNRGAALAKCELLVFVDSDVAVHPDAFVRIRQAFAQNPGVAAVFGSYDDDPAEPDLVSGFRNLLHHHVHTQAAGPGPEARAHHGLNPGGAQDARVGRAERVVAQHPPAVAFGADGPLHRKLSRAGGPADEHHLSWPRRGAEANQHDVAVVQGG